MHKIDEILIDKLCFLSKLSFNDLERETMKNDLGMILNLVQKINQISTDEVEPLIHITTEINRFRDDEPQITLTKEETLTNAPKRDSDYFRVPKFVEKI